MIFPRLGTGHDNQKGFTLLELIIAIAIAGLITAGITMAIMQILTINHRASNHMIAVRQVQQAGKEVSKDALQAQYIVLTDGTGEYPADTNFPLTLNWTDSEGRVNVVVYNITEDGELKRSHIVDGNATATALPVVAQYIDFSMDPLTTEARTRCEWDSVRRLLTFTVTAALGTETETRIYEIEPRPSAPSS
jgi:prepilin-type N-terminal cleavage/methylation domain-containing protein